MRIYIIGYMGSGKTKTAEALAKIFKYDFIDTDKIIEMRANSTITEIFQQEGQEYFRELEKKILHATIKNEKAVISTGGGLPCFSDNMDWMNANGITVFLEANAGLLYHRLATSRAGRPLIESLDDIELMEQITGHLAVRTPFYRKAKIIVNAASLNIKLLAGKIKSYRKS